MADFDPNAMNAAMAQWAARMQQQGQGGSGCIYLLGGIRDVEIKAGSIESGGVPLFKPLPTIASKGKPGFGDKFLAAIQEAGKQLSEINRNTPITTGGSVQAGSNFSSGLAPVDGSDRSLS